jgi:hypothetical protein
MMHMLLERIQTDPDVTIGVLHVNGDYRCWSLEDPVREVPGKPVADWKIKGQTAIPRGTYAVQITPSPRFGKPLPLLIGVDGFTGVRIHPGNTAMDTEGCILVGMDRFAKSIGRSRAAFDPLLSEIRQALTQGGVTLEIR